MGREAEGMTQTAGNRQYPGPKALKSADIIALRLAADGRLVERSATADILAFAYASQSEPVMRVVRRAMETGLPAEDRLTGETTGNYWLVAIPEAEGVLLVARETTLADRTTDALIHSRALLKGLLDRTVDLSFEVDTDGRFRFVSPAIAFGQETDDWIGAEARPVFWPDSAGPAHNPFMSRSARVFEALPVDAFGDRLYADFAVEPMNDSDGRPAGVRGTVRNVSARVDADRAMRVTNLRLTMLQRIAELLNEVVGADELRDRAARLCADLFRADTVWVFEQVGRTFLLAGVAGETQVELSENWVAAAIAAKPDTPVFDLDAPGRSHLLLHLSQGSNAQGAVVLSRDTGVSPWAAQERELLAGIGSMLTAALAKADLVEKLSRLSSSDELTGLLNRRAFRDMVSRRLTNQSRTGSGGCLVFVDLDHFKEVNDTLGHAAGDQALVAFSKALTAIIRPTDLAARYGGDEFVIWLEGVGADVGAEKGRQLIDCMKGVKAGLGQPDLALGVSVGVCESKPGGGADFDRLAEKADHALYEVKKAGRGEVAVAVLD